MRVTCTGDLHFGAGTKYADDRLGEQEQVWSDALDYAIAHTGGLVIAAGDVWHRARPTPAEYLAFARPILARTNAVDVWACPGNHDYLAANQPIGLEVLGKLPNLHVVSTPLVTDIRGAKVGWLPWTPPHTLRAAEPGMDVDEVNALIGGTLLGAARQLRAAGAEVLVAHWSASGAVLPEGQMAQSIMREPFIDGWALAELGFDAVVLGHIHRHQLIVDSPQSKVFYVGSPMPLNFGEGGYPHGIVDLDTSNPEDPVRLRELESRPFVTIDHRDSPEAAVALRMAARAGVRAEAVPPGAILRLRYRATRAEQAQIDVEQLRRNLAAAGASRIYIEPEIVRETRARVAVQDDLEPVEAVQAWLDANDLTDELGVGLVDLTSELLTEVGHG